MFAVNGGSKATKSIFIVTDFSLVFAVTGKICISIILFIQVINNVSALSMNDGDIRTAI